MLSDTDSMPYTWGGVTTKNKNKKKSTKKVSPGFRRWINFNRDYRIAYKKSRGKQPTAKNVSRAYNAITCGAKRTVSGSAKKYCAPRSKSCKGYSKRLKSKSVSKAKKTFIRNKCTGYTKKGKGVFGGMMGGCMTCDGAGCACCGGTGFMDMTPYGGVVKRGKKRCASANSIYNKINDIKLRIRQLRQLDPNSSVLQRYVGILRQLEVFYKRERMLGNKYIDSESFQYPGKPNWFNEEGEFIR